MVKLAGQIAAVRQMQQAWPQVEVVTDRGALPAAVWLRLASGQMLHEALGGSADFCGQFVAARRVL